MYNAGKADWGPVPYNSEPPFKQEKPNLERPILMAAAEQWDYKSFEATATSQLPEHGFIEVTYCLGAERGPNPNLNPDPGNGGIHPQGAPGDLEQANLMSAEAKAKSTVAANTKAQSKPPGGIGATSEKSPAAAEALQEEKKDNGQILEDPRTKEYAEH